MSDDDAAWLLDMLLACQKIERFVRGVDGASFLGDELRQEAILRQLTVLGEAAKNVSPSFVPPTVTFPGKTLAGFATSLYIGIDAYNWPRSGRS